MAITSDRARNVLSFAVVCGFTLMLAGTSKSGSNTSSPSPTPTQVTTAQPTLPTGIPDADMAAVMALANCPRSGHPACRLLTDFAIGTPYTDTPTNANNVLWYGETIGIGAKANFAHEYFFVQVESTPEGVNASPRSVYPGSKEKKEAADVLGALRAGRTPPANTLTSYVKTVGGGMKRLVRTSGSSMALSTEIPHITYMRRLGSRLLVLEYGGSPVHHVGSANGDANAWIGETWILP